MVLLVRHGQARSSDGSYGDGTPLSALGRRQAELAAAALAESDVAAIYSSPHVRALQTAEPLARRVSKKPRVEPRLREFDLGPMPLAEAADRPDLVIWKPEHVGLPGGETLAEFSARVAGLLVELSGAHEGERVALFAHSGTIDAAARFAFGLPPTSAWQHDLPVPNGSITELELWPRGRIDAGAPRYTTFHRIGDTRHLADLASEL